MPPEVQGAFDDSIIQQQVEESLNLDTEIRFHMASVLHDFVAKLLNGDPEVENKALADKLEAEGYHLRITRDLDDARQYLWERYAENREARFGLIASSKDKDLVKFDVPNDFMSTKRINFGPWYGDDQDSQSDRSCRLLTSAITEFGAQGLELDAALVAWGTDFVMKDERWSNAKARGYRNKDRIKDAFQLRLNAYRVLLTRGRDATVIFVPPLEELDSTFKYLLDCGFKNVS